MAYGDQRLGNQSHHTKRLLTSTYYLLMNIDIIVIGSGKLGDLILLSTF